MKGPADSFQARSGQHDKLAVPIVEAVFKRHGFKGYSIGTENDDAKLYELLRAQSDPTSIMLRFRPDRVKIRPGVRAVLCEIKSEAGRYPNFAVEVDSYRAAILWNQQSKHVMFALVDLATRDTYGVWADEFPRPGTVFVPGRWDFEKQRARMVREWPGLPLTPVRWVGGSGTPYMLIPKNHPCLTELDRFIRERVIESIATLGRY